MARSFVTQAATIKQSALATKFENMLTRVSNMIGSNNIYSVWIRLVIGRNESKQLVFDTSSRVKDENMIMSLDYEKTGAGVANEFTFKVAFDLFNYGQTTKGVVEELDELLYQAMNVASLDKAEDMFYCKFQYGYNVVGDTQIVSPLYEGLITDIVPSIDYTSGKTYYTIKGTSFVVETGFAYNFNEIGNVETGEGGWNGLELVLWILWYYHGNNETVDTIYDKGYLNNLNNHSQDWKDGVADKFNIDIPEELVKSASTVCLEQISGMSAIDYCKHVLEKTFNTADPRYYKDEEGSEGYKLKDGETPPRYVLYMTDSSGNGCATIHISYIGSSGDLTGLSGIKTIDFPFEWFNRTNNIVLKWNPEVSLTTYFLARANTEREKAQLARLKKEAEDAQKEAVEDIKEELTFVGPRLPGQAAASAAKVTAAKAIIESSIAQIKDYNSKLHEIHNDNLEYYNSKITLVGIPSDIPLNVMLKIKPKILESVSRTQGTYYITKSRDSISTNGLFTTTIELFRYMNY